MVAVAAGAMVLFADMLGREHQASEAAYEARLYASELSVQISLDGAFYRIGASSPLTRENLADRVRRNAVRLRRLRGIDPERVAHLQAQAQRVLALSENGPIVMSSGPLAAIVNDSLATAKALAAQQQQRAETIRRRAVFGMGVVLVVALTLIAAVTARGHRALLAATRRHAEELGRLAERDELTGLRNRRSLQRDLRRMARNIDERRSREIAICDLDGFKQINDTLGHDAGDRVLTDVARSLTERVADLGTVYRLGGDEFCVVSKPGRSVAPAIGAVLAAGDGAHARGSVGAAGWPTEAPTPDAAMRLADERMYAAKGASRREQAATR